MNRAAMTSRVRLFTIVWCLWFPIAGWAQTHAIRDVRIVSGTGEIIPEGNIVMQDGRITAMGRNVRIPEDAETIDGRGLTAYPGNDRSPHINRSAGNRFDIGNDRHGGVGRSQPAHASVRRHQSAE